MPKSEDLPSRPPISIQKSAEGPNLPVKNGSERGISKEGKWAPTGGPFKLIRNPVLGAVKLQSHHRPHEILDPTGRKGHRKSQQASQPARANDQLMPHFYYPITLYDMLWNQTSKEGNGWSFIVSDALANASAYGPTPCTPWSRSWLLSATRTLYERPFLEYPAATPSIGSSTPRPPSNFPYVPAGSRTTCSWSICSHWHTWIDCLWSCWN